MKMTFEEIDERFNKICDNRLEANRSEDRLYRDIKYYIGEEIESRYKGTHLIYEEDKYFYTGSYIFPMISTNFFPPYGNNSSDIRIALLYQAVRKPFYKGKFQKLDNNQIEHLYVEAINSNQPLQFEFFVWEYHITKDFILFQNGSELLPFKEPECYNIRKSLLDPRKFRLF